MNFNPILARKFTFCFDEGAKYECHIVPNMKAIDAFCPSLAFPSDRVMDKDLPLGSLSVKQSQRVEVRECRE